MAAGAAFVVDIVVSVGVSLVTAPKPVEELAGLVYSETPKEDRTDPRRGSLPWYRRPTLLAGISLAMVITLNVDLPLRSRTWHDSEHRSTPRAPSTSATSSPALIGFYGSSWSSSASSTDRTRRLAKTGGVNANLWVRHRHDRLIAGRLRPVVTAAPGRRRGEGRTDAGRLL